jgi:uncharacterized membrane protein
MGSVAPKASPTILHPLLNPIPVAFFTAAFLLDYRYWQMGAGARAALWLIGIGLLLSAVAIVIACVDVLRDRRVLRLPEIGVYISGVLTAYTIEFINWCARYFEGTHAIVPMGFELSAFAVLILAMTAWIGWKLNRRRSL